MRIRLLLIASLLGPAFLHGVHAQQAPSASALVGKWRGAAQNSSGATVVSVTQFTPDMKFTTSATMNGSPLMEAAGRWKVSGKTLEWTYERSSHPAIPSGFLDVDEIDSVAADEIILVSKRSGKRHRYQRVK